MNGELIEAARVRISAAADAGDMRQLRGQLDDLLQAIGQGSPIAIEGGRETVFFGPQSCGMLLGALAALAEGVGPTG